MNLKLGLIHSPNVLHFLTPQRWNKFHILPGEPWVEMWSFISRRFSALSVRPWLITTSGDFWWWNETKCSHVWQWASATWCAFMETVVLAEWTFRAAARWGKRRVRSKSCQYLMINGTTDRCLFKFAFVLGISWTVMSPFLVKLWNAWDAIRAYPNCHHHHNQVQTNPFQSCLELLMFFHQVPPTFAFFWTQWLSVQVAQGLQMRTLCYT